MWKFPCPLHKYECRLAIAIPLEDGVTGMSKKKKSTSFFCLLWPFRFMGIGNDPSLSVRGLRHQRFLLLGLNPFEPLKIEVVRHSTFSTGNTRRRFSPRGATFLGLPPNRPRLVLQSARTSTAAASQRTNADCRNNEILCSSSRLIMAERSCNYDPSVSSRFLVLFKTMRFGRAGM